MPLGMAVRALFSATGFKFAPLGPGIRDKRVVGLSQTGIPTDSMFSEASTFALGHLHAHQNTPKGGTVIAVMKQ